MSDVPKSVDVEEITLPARLEDEVEAGQVSTVRPARGKSKKEVFVQEDAHVQVASKSSKSSKTKQPDGKVAKPVQGTHGVEDTVTVEDVPEEDIVAVADGKSRAQQKSSVVDLQDPPTRRPRPKKSKLEQVLDELEDSDSGDASESCDGDAVVWHNTMLVVNEAIEPKLVQYFHKYLNKPSNQGRIWQPSMTSLGDEDEDEDEDADEDEEALSDGEQVVDEEFRKCYVATDTNTLTKLYSMLDDAVDAAVDRYISKYNHFSIVSTKEEYTMLKFDKDDFFAEHIECSGFSEDDGAARRLAVFVILEAPEEGGEFHFIYQGEMITPSQGSILIFPSCPLHPLEVTPVVEGSLIYACNYLI